eukprot:TRINITY_DN1126_c0_g1_i2.p1 TRINITY_DN1126_c0_g1~~TRINITY_DN1126_c0_g1_i2.p1  ORF type:complete len:346 (-),score=78.45 TRINITY_DN1126_c0_g1_i2:118-1155(-)
MTPIPTIAQSNAILGFEGPEKKLEIRFTPVKGDSVGLRSYSQCEWQEVLNSVNCTIISATVNDHFSSYVLSESSLFVYPYQILLKTCGTTTLLLAIPGIEKLAKAIGATIELITFARKSLNFPERQLYPHNSFDDEVAYLNKYFNENGHKHGNGHTLGNPTDKDQWFIYVADFRQPERVSSASQQVFEVMMHDLDPVVMQHFYHKEGVTAKQTTINSGISTLLKDSVIDDFQFEPCGYSMNGLRDEHYWTIHITPEPHCSYVSFETNKPFASYSYLLHKVLNVFNPGRATITVVADAGAPCGNPADTFNPHSMGKYTVRSHTLQEISSHAYVAACNIVRNPTPPA